MFICNHIFFSVGRTSFSKIYIQLKLNVWLNRARGETYFVSVVGELTCFINAMCLCYSSLFIRLLTVTVTHVALWCRCDMCVLWSGFKVTNWSEFSGTHSDKSFVTRQHVCEFGTKRNTCWRRIELLMKTVPSLRRRWACLPPVLNLSRTSGSNCHAVESLVSDT